jgi:hypothetical protein
MNPSTGLPIRNFFCHKACKGAWQERARPISKEDLRRMYIDEARSANDIAKIVGRNSKRVWEWLVADGIETRPRGHDERVHFKPGHKLGVGRAVGEDQRQTLREARRKDGSKGLFRPDGTHVLKGRRGAAHPSFKGGLTPERQAFYASDEWKAACKVVWHRADAKCERCGLDHREIDRDNFKFHVHHIVSFQVRELRAEPSNLVLLCAPCHRFVHSRHNEARDFIKDRAA